jgi:hypothetical protein
MKLLTGCLVLALLGATTGADAWPSWPWSRNRKPRLPKPIDFPIVRPRAQAEKAKRQQHPSKYERPEWGQEWDRTLDIKRPKEGNHSLYQD